MATKRKGKKVPGGVSLSSEAGHAMIQLLEMIHRDLLRIRRQIARLCETTRPTIGLYVAGVVPKEGAPMSQLPPFSTDSSNNIQFAPAPKDGAGNPTTPTLQWSVSDPSVIALQVAPDTLSALGVTAPGTCVVDVSSADGASDRVEITVSQSGTVSIGLGLTAVPK